MHFPMKIQPIDAGGAAELAQRSDPARPAAKSRLKRLWQFPSVLRSSSAEKLAGAGDEREKKREDAGDLDAMLFRFSEEGSHEKPPRGRCICFNANFDDSSDDDFEARDADAPPDAAEVIKGLVPCASVTERNLLADASKILEKAVSENKHVSRRMVVDGLRSAGYDAAICKSQWNKNPSFPTGEYEYVDVVVADGGGHRLLVDVDFKSEFEVARPTKSYRAVLQNLPSLFVGPPDRLQRIVALASAASRQSLKKKGLHVPPWRRSDYMQAKWLSPSYQRTTDFETQDENSSGGGGGGGSVILRSISALHLSNEFNSSAGEDETIKVKTEPRGTSPASPKAGDKLISGLSSIL
ncbi:uncharacterized protein LOC122002075 [Zingiber officinale]|uniref:Plant-specific domain TIGR01615 family protein n=1 Tax=Zingiber officinale TaxID=94328 RepID=A0A8J5FSD1_ZINOF|nr:uncharacterized protein LOC122002075 [Zingiber officinale]KAG6493439.1 hypothetical protein ZIOFF_048425 [Zingiber officinale]